MSIELKPCPFCGGEANLVEDPYNWVWSIGCSNDKCLGFSGLGWTYTSEREAAEAWNTRAERTCFARPHYSTRSDTFGTVIGFDCSECAYALTQDPDRPILWRYCPNCGAKVVE